MTLSEATVSQLVRMFEQERRYVRIDSSLSLTARFSAIRLNYAVYRQEVENGDASWLVGDPYQIADWITIFTPIEMAAWQDIRYYGVPLWPQLPVGRYFADFGNPVAKVALECDGAAFHSPEKDAARDRDFRRLGWRVIRAPGWQCVRVMPSESELCENGEDPGEGYSGYRDQMTLGGIMKELRAELRAWSR